MAVTSGKGGVGKSVITVNLAETLVQLGYNVAVVDVDFGQSACPLLLNETPEFNVTDVLQHTAQIADIYHRTSEGITLVQTASEAGRAESFGQALYESLDQVLDRLRAMNDFILIDTPAGTGTSVRWALDQCDMGLLVLVGEPTAISDAYQLARMVWNQDPGFNLGAIVNFADTEAEARSVAHRFSQVTGHFTNRVTNYLGWVPFSAHVRQSVSRQTTAIRTSGPVQNAFRSTAERLVNGKQLATEPLSLN